MHEGPGVWVLLGGSRGGSEEDAHRGHGEGRNVLSQVSKTLKGQKCHVAMAQRVWLPWGTRCTSAGENLQQSETWQEPGRPPGTQGALSLLSPL